MILAALTVLIKDIKGGGEEGKNIPVLFCWRGWHCNPLPNWKSQGLSAAFCHISPLFMPPAAVLLQHRHSRKHDWKEEPQTHAWLDCVFPQEQQGVKMIGIILPLALRQNVNNGGNSLMLSSPKGQKKGSLIWGNWAFSAPKGGSVAYKHILLHGVVKTATCNTKIRFFSLK